jgi:arylsulfatase A-like enzyme
VVQRRIFVKKLRKNFLFSLFCLFGILINAAVPLRGAEARKNVLLITIDTLRADRLSCYSSEHVKTPNIDALAAKSTVFTRAFALTSTTLPSHANILLGMTPLYHGVHDNLNFKVRDEYLTLAEHLKKEGYATGAFVGAFPLDSRFGLSQGFDTYDGDFGLTVSGEVVSAERPAEEVVIRALEWLNQQKSPWFLWVHCYDPHDPYEPPEPYRSQYRSSPYEGEVAYVDSAMKKLFRYLEDRDLMEKTVIAFTGDHGESLVEHGEITHGYLAYNSSIWIPLFIFNPGMKPQVIHHNVSHIDMFPTICDILNIERPPFLLGISLLPSMKGKNLERRIIYFESLLPFYDLGWAPIRGTVQGHDKFIDSPIPELYDLEKDFHIILGMKGPFFITQIITDIAKAF